MVLFEVIKSLNKITRILFDIILLRNLIKLSLSIKYYSYIEKVNKSFILSHSRKVPLKLHKYWYRMGEYSGQTMFRKTEKCRNYVTENLHTKKRQSREVSLYRLAVIFTTSFSFIVPSQFTFYASWF